MSRESGAHGCTQEAESPLALPHLTPAAYPAALPFRLAAVTSEVASGSGLDPRRKP